MTIELEGSAHKPKVKEAWLSAEQLGNSEAAQDLSDPAQEGPRTLPAAGHGRIPPADTALNLGEDIRIEMPDWDSPAFVDGTAPVANMVGELLTHMLSRAMLLSSRLILSRAAGADELWEQLKSLYTDPQLSVTEKMGRLTGLLRSHKRLIPPAWQDVVDQVIQGVESVHALHQCVLCDDETMVVRLQRSVELLQKLLALPQVERSLPDALHTAVSAFLEPMRQTLVAVQAFAALPDDAPFTDYLATIKRILAVSKVDNGAASPLTSTVTTVIETLETVSTFTAEMAALSSAYPGRQAPLNEQLDWFAQALKASSTRRVLDHLLSGTSLEFLQQSIPWFKQLSGYPADGTLAAQFGWLNKLLNDRFIQEHWTGAPSSLAAVLEPLRELFNTVQRAVQDVPALQASYPGEKASLEQQLTWITADVMTTPSAEALLKQALSTEQRQRLQQSIRWCQRLSCPPRGQTTLLEQVRWLSQLVSDPLIQGMVGDVVPQGFIDALTPWLQAFETVKTTYQDINVLYENYPGAGGDFPSQLAWLAQVLKSPSTKALLAQVLPPYIVGMLDTLPQIMPWFETLSRYPSERPLSEQMLWLTEQLGKPETQSVIRQTPLQPVIEQIKQGLGGDAGATEWLNTLIKLADPEETVGQKLKQVFTQAISPRSLKWAVGTAIEHSPLAPLQDVWAWLEGTTPGLTWEQTLAKVMADIRANADPLIRQLPAPVQVVARGVLLAAQYPAHGSWKDTLKWAARLATAHPELEFVYNRFMEASLAKGVYDALQLTDVNAQEDALRQVANDLRHYWPQAAQAGGGQLIVLIPLLPGLLSIGKDIYRLPRGQSWLGWVNSILRIIHASDNPALQRLKEQLEAMIENQFVEVIGTALDSWLETVGIAPNAPDAGLLPEAGARHHAGGRNTAMWTERKTASPSDLSDALLGERLRALRPQVDDSLEQRLSMLKRDRMPALSSPPEDVGVDEFGLPVRLGDRHPALPEARMNAGTVNSLTNDVWSGVANLMGSFKFPGVEATPRPVLPLHRERVIEPTSPLLEVVTHVTAPSPDPWASETGGVVDSNVSDLTQVEKGNEELADGPKSTFGIGLKAGLEAGMAGGVGLLLGAAILTWKTRQAAMAKSTDDSTDREMEVFVPSETQEGHGSAAEPTLSSPLNGKTHLPAETAQPSIRAALNRYKTPLGMGLGGLLLFGAAAAWYANAYQQERERQSAEELKKAKALIDELEVPYLDFLVDEEPEEIEATPPQSVPMTKSGKEPLPSEQTHRAKRFVQGLSISTPSAIPKQIERLKKRIGFAPGQYETHFVRMLQEAVEGSVEMKEAVFRTPQQRAVIHLIKSLEKVAAYLKNLESWHLSKEETEGSVKIRSFYDGLWKIADGLSDTYGQTKVAEYKQLFLMSDLTAEGTSTTEVPSTSAPSLDLRNAIKTHGEQALSDIAALYDPILNPVEYLDEHIAKTIFEFNKERGTQFTSEHKVTIKLMVQLSKQADGKFPYEQLTVRQYSLRDIAAGHFRAELDSLAGGNTTAYDKYESDHEKNLVARLWKSDAQTHMLGALKAYEKTNGLQTHYKNQIRIRCVEYLDSPDRLPAFEAEVTRFLAGETNAKEVFFNGVKLNGVFLVPYREYGGVLFSVDEPGFFHVHDTALRSYRDHEGAWQRTPTTRSSFPQSKEFRKWVFNKIPGTEAAAYQDVAAPFRTKIRDWGPGGPITFTRPLTFTDSSSVDDLPQRLFDGLMQRLKSDIDKMVYNPKESNRDAFLEIAKSILALLALGLNVAVPGSGSVLSRVALLLANLVIDAAYVSIALKQSSLANDPDRAQAYRNEAIIGGVLGSVLALIPGASLGHQGVRHTLQTYRTLKAVSREAIPELLARMNWARLADSHKITFLAQVVRNSDDARDLVRLSGSPDAVEQSIRQSQPQTGYAWKDVDTELVRIRDHLKSEMERRLGGPLTNVQLKELKRERDKYLIQVDTLKSRKRDDFTRGKLEYETLEVNGVNRDMSELELTTFFNNPPRSLNAEQRGVISALIENAHTKRVIDDSMATAVKYSKQLKPGSTQHILSPQTYILKAAGASEKGRCFPMVESLAVALKNNNTKTFFDNLYSSAAQSGASKMVPAFDVLHGLSLQPYLKPIKFSSQSGGTVNAIVDTVGGASGTTLFSMHSRNHAMMVGVTVDAQAVKTFHFYDPNVGFFSYSSVDDLKMAMQRTVGTKGVGDHYGAYGSSEPKYRLSEIDTEALGAVELHLPGNTAGEMLTVRGLSDQEMPL